MAAAVEQLIFGLKVTSSPLPFPIAQELLPEVAEFITRATREFGPAITALLAGDKPSKEEAIVAMLPTLEPTSVKSLLESLTAPRNARRLLQSTIVVMENFKGAKENYELRDNERATEVFEEHPEAFIPILLFAGKVTFKRFFPGSAQLVGKTRSESS